MQHFGPTMYGLSKIYKHGRLLRPVITSDAHRISRYPGKSINPDWDFHSFAN